MSGISKLEIRGQLRNVSKDAEQYFAEAQAADDLIPESSESYSFYKAVNHYWNRLSDGHRKMANELLERILPLCAELAEAIKTSPLTGTEDLHDVKIATKAIRSAIRLRSYIYRQPDAIHDEGSVLGFRPADQSELAGLSPKEAETAFFEHLATLGTVLKLVEASPDNTGDYQSNPSSQGTKYRPDTAFIMMWMNPNTPSLQT